MKIWKCSWCRVNWSAYWNDRGNWVLESGEFYTTSFERAQELCPITEKQGSITYEEIEVIS